MKVTVGISKQKVSLNLWDPGDPTPPLYENALSLTCLMNPRRAREVAEELLTFADLADKRGQGGSGE